MYTKIDTKELEKSSMLSTKDYKHFRIVSEAGDVLSTFEGAGNAGKALPGDFVKATETGCILLERTRHPPLVGIVHFDSKVKYGLTSRNIPIYMFTPLNESYPPFLVGSSLQERTNHLGLATFENWETTTFPRGSLQRILGSCGQESVEKEALALQYSPWKQRSKDIPTQIILPSKENRFVLNAPTINIDPEGCIDIDDVVSLWLEGDTYTCAISIADVAAFYSLNPFLGYAQKIGATLYQNGTIIRPLFDLAITEMMSLLPGKERFAVSLFFTWNGKEIKDIEWKETLLTNTASYSYSNCYDAKEINIKVLQEICSFLGEPTDDSHKWIESLMLFYNTEAAKLLVQKGQGLLRAHDKPQEEKLSLYERLGLPAKELAFPAATYVPVGKEAKHWGLQKEVYCHASSPIRRFADVLNQMVLKGQILSGWDSLAYHLNALQKNNKQHDRDYFFLEQLFTSETKQIEGIVVGEKIYIPAWKRFVKASTNRLEGEKVSLRFYARMSEKGWKNRIVFECLDA
jgi:exoribonuclease R